MSAILDILRQITCAFFILLSTHTLAINDAVNRNATLPGSTRHNLLSTRETPSSLNAEETIESTYTLQEATEQLFIFGVLFRMHILHPFGSLRSDRYEDFDTCDVACRVRAIRRKTFERKYDVLALADLHTRPSKICRLIRDNVNACPVGCCHDDSDMCKRISEHDEAHTDTLSASALEVALHVHQSANLSQHNSDGIHLNRVLYLLKTDSLQSTPSLLLGIVHHARHDNIADDRVYVSERELARLLVESSICEKHSADAIVRLMAIITHRSASEPFRETLRNGTNFFPNYLKRHVRLLSERINDRVHLVDEVGRAFGQDYENDTFPLKYRFHVVLQEDALEIDVVEARDFLVRELTRSTRCADKYRNERLVVEILNELKEIDYAGDIAAALRIHARFSRGSHVIERPSDLTGLLDDYENLRYIPRFRRLATVIDGIERDLRNSKNVSIRQLCRAPRACLRRGFKIVQQCTHVNSAAKDLISEFETYVTPTCAFTENRCPKAAGAAMNTFRTSPSSRDDKECTSAESMVPDIPVKSDDFAESMLPTTDGPEESDGIEIIRDSGSRTVSREFTSGETGKKRELWRDSAESEISKVEFADEGRLGLPIEDGIEGAERAAHDSVRDFSSESVRADDLLRIEDASDADNESHSMTKRSMLSEENVKPVFSSEGTSWNDSCLLLHAYTRHPERSMISSTSTPTDANEATLIVTTVTAPMTVMTPKMTEHPRATIKESAKIMTIPTSLKSIGTIKAAPRITRISMRNVSVQDKRKVFEKRSARLRHAGVDCASEKKNSTQVNACSLRCKSPRCPGRSRCTEGSRDSSARSANKDNSKKPEVAPRFEELNCMWARSESSRTESRKDTLCQGSNYQFNVDKNPECEIGVSTCYSALDSGERRASSLVKTMKSRLKNGNRASRRLYNARQIVGDRIRSVYKLVKERSLVYDKKARRTPIMSALNVCRTLSEDESRRRRLTVTVENFLKQNGSRNPRIESRRKRKIARRRRQSRIIRPKGRKHNKMHVKSHATKSVTIHQRRRKSMKSLRRIKTK